MTERAPAGLDLTADDPWLRRFRAWAWDRFPPALALLNLVLYAAAVAVGRMAAGDAAGTGFGVQEVVGFFAFWSFSLVMRIYDEHKDYERDCVNHPDRILQRGLVTLGQLRLLAAGALMLQAGTCLWLDGGVGPVTVVWLAATAYSVLTAVEFFVGDWLEQRPVLYAVSHGVVMPLVVLWGVTIGARRFVLADPAVVLLAVEGLLSAFSFEVTRKIKAPEEERDTVDSYTKVWGTRGAPKVAVGLVTAAAAVLVALLAVVGGVTVATAVLAACAVVLTAVAWVPFLRFLRAPEPGFGPKLEAATGLHLLGGYLLVLAAVLLR